MTKKKRFSTTIKQIFWSQKTAQIRENIKHRRDPFFIEYKNMSKFWNTRIQGLDPPCPGVFLLGCVAIPVTVVKVDTVSRVDSPVKDNTLFTTARLWAIKCELTNDKILNGG